MAYGIVDWVTDLESGDYSQAQSSLCRVEDDHKSFCCLGVAAHKIIGDGLETDEGTLYWVDDIPDLPNREGIKFSDGDDLYETGTLPLQVRIVLGIDCSQESRYIEMNDEEGRSFAEIAAEVREDFPELFDVIEST